MKQKNNQEIFDITFIGAGPTGLFGAFYAGLREMTVKVIDALPQPGGQLIALYPEKQIFDTPGLPAVVSKDLVSNLVEQAEYWKPAMCMDERCQVFAIEEKGDAYEIIEDKCIGCGLCISTCPSDAISLIRKNQEDIVLPPVDENDWYRRRAQMRGVDHSKYA